MAAIGPQRIRVSADQSVFRVAALNAAVASLGPYNPGPVMSDGTYDDIYLRFVQHRYREFLALLEEGEVETLGQPTDRAATDWS